MDSKSPNWPILEFENVCLEKRGAIISGPFGSNIGRKFFVKDGVPVIRGNNISEKFELFKDDGFVFVSKNKAEELGTWAIEDDLIFTAAGTLGQVGIIPKKRKFDKYIISNKQMRARLDKTKVLPFYAFLWFKTGKMVEYIKSRSTGSTIPLINLSVLRSLPISVPPIAEQKGIVMVIMSLSNKIELNQKMNKTLEAIAQAIFKHWFIDFEFPNEEGKPYKSSGGEMVDSELGEIPKGWKIGYLGDLLNIRREHCDPSQETRTLPYVPIDCISKRSLMLTDHKPGEEARSSLIKFHKFDIIFGAMRPYFHKVCIAPFEGTTRTTAFVFYPKYLNDYAFLLLTVFSERTIKYANLNSTGSTIPYAAWENSLETMPIVIPFTEVRHNFNKIIVNLLISIGEYLPNQIVTLKNIRDSLLPKLMSGKIRVPLED